MDDKRIMKKQAEVDFLDPAMEWRRLAAEAWGVFMIVLISSGVSIAYEYQGGHCPVWIRAATPGMIIMVMKYVLGEVSGAHINPATTFAFVLRGNFPWRRVPGYMTAQLTGGIVAAMVLKLLFGVHGTFGATFPGYYVTDLQACLIETLLTAGMVNTILGTATGARNIGSNSAIAVGSYIIIAGFFAEALTGASMNPVRSIAPDLLRGDMSTSWIYLVGPLCGAIIGVVIEWIIKGKPTVSGDNTAQGKNAVAE